MNVLATTSPRTQVTSCVKYSLVTVTVCALAALAVWRFYNHHPLEAIRYKFIPDKTKYNELCSASENHDMDKVQRILNHFGNAFDLSNVWDAVRRDMNPTVVSRIINQLSSEQPILNSTISGDPVLVYCFKKASARGMSDHIRLVIQYLPIVKSLVRRTAFHQLCSNKSINPLQHIQTPIGINLVIDAITDKDLLVKTPVFGRNSNENPIQVALNNIVTLRAITDMRSGILETPELLVGDEEVLDRTCWVFILQKLLDKKWYTEDETNAIVPPEQLKKVLRTFVRDKNKWESLMEGLINIFTELNPSDYFDFNNLHNWVKDKEGAIVKGNWSALQNIKS